jgi:hypothetical protein
MKNTALYEKHIRDIPGNNTVKILKKRQIYLVKKIQEKMDTNSYFNFLAEELHALKKTTNFIEWIHHNAQNDIVKGIFTQYERENINS